MNTLFYLLICVTFLACGKGNKGTSEQQLLSANAPQEEKINNRPYFKYEHSFSSLGVKGVKPKLTNDKYVSYTISRNKDLTKLNYNQFEKGTREVIIQGIEVILGGENSHNVFELIRKTTDVAKLNIYAHTIVIHDEIHVAQADVELHAVKIIFKAGGKINTTPVSKSELPKTYLDGVNGLNAGSIKINAFKVENESSEAVLFAHGGSGQAAGPGVHGARGRDAKIVKSPDYTFYKYYKCENRGAERGDYCEKKKKSGWKSGDGKDAKVGGMPGRGGKGGTITLGTDVFESLTVSNKGGLHGHSDILRVGGKAGRPLVTCSYIINKRKNCVRAKNGRNASAKKHDGKEGEKGPVIKTFKRPDLGRALYQYNEFGKDLYMNHFYDEAVNVYRYLKELVKSSNPESYVLFSVNSEISTMLHNLDLRLDFYGNPRSWVPKLGFVAASKAFVNEGEQNLRLFFLSKILRRKYETLELKRGDIKELQSELFKRIKLNRHSITENVINSNQLKHSLERLSVAKEEFELELQKIEESIRNTARKNLKVPFFQKALETVALAAKVVPVGQPSFGAVGIGVDLLKESIYSNKSFGQLLEKAPEVSESFEEFDWKGATLELQRKLDSLNPLELARIKGTKKKLDYLKDLGAFAGPIADAIAKQRKIWKDAEVSKSSLEKEINRIKMKHADFQRVIGKLHVLLNEKEIFLGQMRVFQTSILKKLNQIDSDFLAIAHSYEELESPEFNLGNRFKNSLIKLNSDTLRRFNYYSYILSKAYVYKYARPFPGKMILDSFYRKCEFLIAQNATNSETLERIKDMFQSEVSALVEVVVLGTKARDELATTIELSDGELRALNGGSSIYLDFTELSFFGKNKENIRLKAIKLEEDSGFDGGDGEEIRFEHVGEGMVSKGGKFYFFTQDVSNSGNWISNLVGGEIYHSTPSAESGDEIRALLGMSDGQPVYTAPTGRTFIKVSTTKGLTLNWANIRVEYTFEHTN